MKNNRFLIVISWFIVISICGFVSNGAANSSAIVINTDKTQYSQDEAVKLKVTNGLNVPVWYIGYPQRDLVFWSIEQAQGNDWKPLDFRLPLLENDVETCRVILYEQPIGDITELKPHSDLLYEWNQKICLNNMGFDPVPPEMLERGRYRFVLRYSLGTVKSENIESEPWKRPVELGEKVVVYSNEFSLK